MGDQIEVTGVVSKYNPDADARDIYQIVIAKPSDFEFNGLPKYYMLIILAVISFITVIIIGWIVLLKRQVRKQTKLIRDSLREKEVLLQEIHHRVKNNLAIISGLIELQLDSTSSLEARQVLRDSQVRIKSMAMVHEKLYESSSLSSIEMDKYIKDLVEAISNTFTKFQNDVQIEMNIGSIELPLERVIPCGLLVNELVVNAYKHAFKKMDDGKQGQLSINLQRSDTGLKLSVADNGPGLPGDFSFEKNESLGMMLIQTFAAQLGASIDFSSNGGTSFKFYFTAG